MPINYAPRTKAQDAEIRGSYARGVTLVELQEKFHRSRITLNAILGIVPVKRRTRMSRPAIITPVVQPEAISPMAFVRAFEERVREYHDAIEKLTQERNAARNETASLRVQLVNAVNGTKADLEQLEAAGKRVSAPLGGG
jgi:hypothetical protein